MKVSVHNHQTDAKICKEEVAGLVEALAHYKGLKSDEVDFYFVDEKAMATVHHLAFGDPSTTDCVTFPIDALGEEEKPHHLGEAFICPKVAAKQALEHNTEIDEEISLYITHCFLHFIGFEDTTPEKARQMRLEEKKCLEHLKKRGLLLKNSLSITP